MSSLRPKSPDTDSCSVYVFLGKDPQQIKASVLELEEQLSRTLRCSRIDKTTYFADETNFTEIVCDLNTFPLFSTRKIIQVYRAEKLPYTQLQAYLNNPANNSVLILMSDQRLKDWNKSLVGVLKAKAIVKDYFPSANYVLHSLKKYFADRAVPYEEEAVVALSENMHHNDMQVSQVFDMLDAVTSPECPFALNDALQLLTGAEYSVFEWIDALFNRNLSQALYVFHQFRLNEDLQYSSFVSLLYRQLHLMCGFFMARQSHTPENLLLQTLKIPPFLLKKLSAQAKHWTLKEMLIRLELLSQVEFRVKSLPQSLLPYCFEVYIVEFCNRS